MTSRLRKMANTNLEIDVIRALVVAFDPDGFGKAADRLGRMQA